MKMLHTLSSRNPGVGASTVLRGAINLLSVSALTFAPMVGAYAQAYAQTCDDIKTGGDITRSVVVTKKKQDESKPGVFDSDNADFSLQCTLGQIIETAGAVNTPAERIAMMRSIVRSFNRSEFENPDSDLLVPVQVRPEANLDPIELLSQDAQEGMHPVGVFNRFDLVDAARPAASTASSTCSATGSHWITA
jgi:hypothetical protein